MARDPALLKNAASRPSRIPGFRDIRPLRPRSESREINPPINEAAHRAVHLFEESPAAGFFKTAATRPSPPAEAGFPRADFQPEQMNCGIFAIRFPGFRKG